MLLLDIVTQSLHITPINILLQILIKRHLFDSFCVVMIWENNFDLTFNQSIYVTKPNGTLEELMHQMLAASEKGCSDYIVNMRDPKIFMNAFDQVSVTGNIRRSNRKIIFTPFSDEKNNDNVYSDIISMKESSFVANILFIIPKKDETNCTLYNIMTHEFMNSECDKMLILDQWNSCTEEFEKKLNLFPHNIKNLNGKQLKVAAFTYKPYILLDLDTSLAPAGRDGIDIRIIEEFCKWINCTIELVREDIDLWGDIYENRTGYGVLGRLIEDRADIGICSLYSWYNTFLHMDFSAPYVRTAVTCVAPSPRLVSSWEVPFMPFTWHMWVAVMCSYVFACFGLTIANKCSKRNVLLAVFGMMIAQSQDVGSSWRIRSVIGWLLATSLILVNAYGAGLAATFTVPQYEPSIDTMEDIVERGLEWGAPHDAWTYSLLPSNEALVKKLLTQFRVYTEDELKRKSFTRSLAFSIEKLPGGHYAIGEYITEEALLDMTIMLEDFYFEQCVIMFRKSSPYTEKMSELIGRLHQSGLLLAWEEQIVLKYLNYKVQQEVKLSRSKNDVDAINPLNLNDVMGIFILYGSGTVLATLIFCGERLTRVRIGRLN